MNSGIPSYFAVDKSYQTIPVGHVSHFSVIVNDPNYDFFVLAGISKNELFSKLVMQNMNIAEGRAFDTERWQSIQSIGDDLVLSETPRPKGSIQNI